MISTLPLPFSLFCGNFPALSIPHLFLVINQIYYVLCSFILHDFVVIFRVHIPLQWPLPATLPTSHLTLPVSPLISNTLSVSISSTSVTLFHLYLALIILLILITHLQEFLQSLPVAEHPRRVSAFDGSDYKEKRNQ